jgi:hypothetical protein
VDSTHRAPRSWLSKGFLINLFKFKDNICLHPMVFGRLRQYAKYSYRVWESFAHQASTILRTFCVDPISRSENNSSNAQIWDPQRRKDVCYQPERRLGSQLLSVVALLSEDDSIRKWHLIDILLDIFFHFSADLAHARVIADLYEMRAQLALNGKDNYAISESSESTTWNAAVSNAA